MCVHVRAAYLRQKHLWCVMEQSSGVHFWAEGSKHCCVYWICSAYWICSVSESFCLENYWKTDLTGQTESGQFLRSVSMISSLFFRRKFGFSGTGGKIGVTAGRIFKWVSEINDKWKMMKQDLCPAAGLSLLSVLQLQRNPSVLRKGPLVPTQSLPFLYENLPSDNCL